MTRAQWKRLYALYLWWKLAAAEEKRHQEWLRAHYSKARHKHRKPVCGKSNNERCG